MPNKKEIEFNSFLDELESSKPIDESPQDKEKEFESFLDGLEVGEESVKKKDIPSESLVSEFQYQEVDINEVQAELYDSFFESQVGISGPVKASRDYAKAKEKGLDDILAAKEAGIPVVEEVGAGGVVERVVPPGEWGELEDDAKQYVESNMKRVMDSRIGANIEGLIATLHENSSNVKDPERNKKKSELRQKLGEQLLLRRKYGLEGDSTEDLKKELDDISVLVTGGSTPRGMFSLGKVGYKDNDPRLQDRINPFEPSTVDPFVKKDPLNNISNFIKFNTVESLADASNSKLKVLKTVDFDRYLFKEAESIIAEAQALQGVDYSDSGVANFAGGLVSGLGDRISGIFGSLENVLDHAGVGEIGKRGRLFRDEKKVAMEGVQDKFSKIGSGDMSVDDLSDAELSLYLATVVAGEAMQGAASKIPFTVKSGEGIGTALGFMLEIAATRGKSSSVARNTARDIVLKRMSGLKAPSLKSHFVSNGIAAITDATITTAKMPSFFSGAIDRYLDGDDMYTSIMEGYKDTYWDVLASSIFTMPINANSGLNSAAQQFWARSNSTIGQSSTTREAFKAWAKEYTEEQFASIAHAADGAKSIADFRSRMPDVEQQLLIATTTGVLTAGGRASNVVDRAKTEIDFRKSGRMLGAIKQDIDVILSEGAMNIDQALRMVSESIDATAKDATEWVNLYTHAAKYITNHKVMMSWDGNRPTNTANVLDDGAFIEGEVSGDVMGKGQAFVVRHDKITDKETITLSNRISSILAKFAAFEKVSHADMVFARDQLTLMEPFLTEANNKAVIKGFVSDFDAVVGDMKNTSELINEVRKKPRLTATKAEVPLAEGEVLSQEMRVDIDGRRSGYVQEVKIGDVTKYNLFSNSKKLIGQYDTKDALGEGLKKHTAERAARRIKRDVVNEGTPKEYIKELSSKLHKAAKQRSSSNPLEGLEAKKNVADALNTYVTRGKMTSKQAVAITKFLAKVDLTRPIQRNQFLSYAETVIDDAENISNYDARKGRRASVLRTSKQKQVSPDVSRLAKEFGKIKPLEVTDHSKYMEHADAIMAGMSRSRGDKETGEVKQRKTVITAEVQDYIDSEMKRQAEAEAELQKRINKELTGYEDVSLESIRELADNSVAELLNKAGIEKGSTKEAVKQWVENARPRVRAVLKGQELTEAGEPLDMTDHGKNMVDQFMKLNIDNLTDAQALRVLDGLDSFLKNGTLFGMEHAVMMAEGVVGPQKLMKAGIKGKSFWTIYPGKWASRFLGEKFASLPVFNENVFRGRDNADMVTKASGFRDVMIGYSKAAGRAQKLAIDFHKKFGDQEVNGESFMSRRNIFERGLWGELIRDSESENAQENFDKSKKQIHDSMLALRDGDKRQRDMSTIYEQLYNDFLEGSESVEAVKAKLSENGKTNMEAVEWWMNEFKNVAPHLKALVEGIHNKSLNLESYYTPRTFRKVNPEIETKSDVVEEFKTSAFQERTGSLVPKQAGILMGKKDFTDTPVNKYLDLNFDNNMGNAMEGGLLDLYTSPHIVKLAAFVNAPGFEALFGDQETADIFKKRVISYVHDISGRKSANTSKYMKDLMPFIQQYAATRALGRSTMAAQQMIPVALNTFINTLDLDLRSMYGKDANAINRFIDNSGYGIALRGAQSRGDLPTAEEFYGKGNLFTKASKKTSDFYLNTFLIDRDRRIARASWLTYYKNRLKRLGVDTKKIDWETHKIDNAKHRKAADYAEHMINRQQNVSDAALMGEFLKSKGDSDKMLRATFFVFANFVMNQKMRMQTDIAILNDPATSFEDRIVAGRSLAGVVAEQAAFHSMGSLFRFWMQDLARWTLGIDESDEEREERKRKRDRKTLQYFATDLLSPAPIVDKPFVAIGRVLEYLRDDVRGEESEEYLFNNYGGDDIFEAFGVISMGIEDVSNIINMGSRAIKGDYRKTFAGNVTKKYLTDTERTWLGIAAGARTLHSFGVLPTDAKMWADYVMRAIDKQAETLPAMEKRQKKHNEILKRIREGSGAGSESTSVGGKQNTSY